MIAFGKLTLKTTCDLSDTSFVVVATHQPNKPGPGTGYEFKFVYVKDLGHQYPNGKNTSVRCRDKSLELDETIRIGGFYFKSTFNLTVNNGYGSGSIIKTIRSTSGHNKSMEKYLPIGQAILNILNLPMNIIRVIIPNKPVVVGANYATLLLP